MPTRGKIGSADLSSWGFVGENRQRRFFDEHGLDDGLSRPGRKIRPGDTLTKQRGMKPCGVQTRGPRQPCQQGGKSAAQIFRRTWAGRWAVQARQENSSRGHADETRSEERRVGKEGRSRWSPYQ